MRRFFLFFAILLLFTANIAFAAPVGKVTYVEGKVDVLKLGQTVAISVSKGDSVDVGDIYRAKSNSKAEIVFNLDTLTPQNCGIYTMSFGGYYENPESTWTGKVGGISRLGAYHNIDEEGGHNITSDPGSYWVGDILNGTWSNGRISGLLSGTFISKVRLGTISGDFLGSYYTGDESWQAVSLGVWSGTPLLFFSEISADT